MKYLLLGLILSSSALLLAQRPAAHGERHHRGQHTDGYRATLDSLDLTVAQRATIDSLNAAFRSQRRDGQDADWKTHRANVDAVLTPAQRQRREEISRGEREGRREAADQRRAELRPMYRELKAYHRETVRPAIASVRRDFDAALTDAERRDIATLRDAIATERAAHPKPDRPDGASRAEREAARAAARARREAFKQNYASEIAAVEAIAERHAAGLADARTQLKARHEELAAGADAIRAKYGASDDDRHSRRGGKRDHGHGDRERRGAVRFLLMDVGADDDEVAVGAADEEIVVYPNPATDRATVSFEHTAAGPIRVELIDAAGRVVAVLLDESRDAGSVSVPVDLPADASGALSVRLTEGGRVRTQTILRRR